MSMVNATDLVETHPPAHTPSSAPLHTHPPPRKETCSDKFCHAQTSNLNLSKHIHLQSIETKSSHPLVLHTNVCENRCAHIHHVAHKCRCASTYTHCRAHLCMSTYKRACSFECMRVCVWYAHTCAHIPYHSECGIVSCRSHSAWTEAGMNGNNWQVFLTVCSPFYHVSKHEAHYTTLQSAITSIMKALGAKCTRELVT